MGVRTLLRPLAIFRIPVNEIGKIASSKQRSMLEPQLCRCCVKLLKSNIIGCDWPTCMAFCAGLTVLLSLRFMSLVFEEARNLSLGTAARGINWNNLGPAGGVQILLRLGGRLFSNLMQRSDSIAQAMCARGFVGPDNHKLYLTQTQSSSWTSNIVAAVSLVLLGAAVKAL